MDIIDEENEKKFKMMLNEYIVGISIIISNIIGLFGNINLIVIIFKNKQLQSKSTYLQVALSCSQIICLLFELPNAYLIFYGTRVNRKECFGLIAPYVFFICAQSMIMLMMIIDMSIIVYLPTFYRNARDLLYLICMLAFPVAFSAGIVIATAVNVDLEVLPFCNPPLAMHPNVRYIWSRLSVASNTVILVVFFIILFEFRKRGRKEMKTARQAMRSLKVTIVVFLFSWYFYSFGVSLFAAMGLQGDFLSVSQSDMIFFANLCFCESFYVTMWRSDEYRAAFIQLWSCLPFLNHPKFLDKWAKPTVYSTPVQFTGHGHNSSK